MKIYMNRNKVKKKNHFSPTRTIAFSFLMVILVGSLLLSTPFANKGSIPPYIDNLFVAVSAVCVTGLTPVVVRDTYNIFGQIVIILLVQIGGLGFITFLYLIMYLSRKRVSLRTKMVFTEALNQDNLKQLPRILKTIFIYTITIELVAALIWCIAFLPEFGLAKSIYYGVWHSISAYCNAGFDLLGSSSLVKYQLNPLVNFVCTSEIILGGLGFLVVLDIIDKYKREKGRKSVFNKKHYIQSLSLHTKIVLIMTSFLLISGTILFMICEYHNGKTIGNMSFIQKLMVSFFQSTTTRTAGFATVDMYSLHVGTKIVMCLYMFIGGSPASTAGGVKTVTFALVLILLKSIYDGMEEIYIFNRRIKKRIVLRAFAIVSMALTTCIVAITILSISESHSVLENILMEVFSAMGTVGLSASLTPLLTNVGKIVIMILMYMGRIGPISLIIMFAKKSRSSLYKEIHYPDEDVLVG